MCANKCKNISKLKQTLNKHGEKLNSYALKLTRKNTKDAEDLIQDTIEKALIFINKSGDTEITNCKRWLKKVMKNRFIDTKRKIKRKPRMLDFSEVEDRYINEEQAQIDSGLLTDDTFKNMISDEVLKSIQGLDVKLRTVLLLRVVEQLRHQEIADFVGSPVGTVRYHLKKARKKLYDELYDQAISNGSGSAP